VARPGPSTDGRLLSHLRRQTSTASSGALLKGEHELGSLGQGRRVGDLVRKALLPPGLDGQLLGEGCQVNRSCCVSIPREAMQCWRLAGVSQASLVVLRRHWRLDEEAWKSAMGAVSRSVGCIPGNSSNVWPASWERFTLYGRMLSR
jgi:hypothetical protein